MKNKAKFEVLWKNLTQFVSLPPTHTLTDKIRNVCLNKFAICLKNYAVFFLTSSFFIFVLVYLLKYVLFICLLFTKIMKKKTINN